MEEGDSGGVMGCWFTLSFVGIFRIVGGRVSMVGAGGRFSLNEELSERYVGPGVRRREEENSAGAS